MVIGAIVAYSTHAALTRWGVSGRELLMVTHLSARCMPSSNSCSQSVAAPRGENAPSNSSLTFSSCARDSPRLYENFGCWWGRLLAGIDISTFWFGEFCFGPLQIWCSVCYVMVIKRGACWYPVETGEEGGFGFRLHGITDLQMEDGRNSLGLHWGAETL